jgi:hypothetical protein
MQAIEDSILCAPDVAKQKGRDIEALLDKLNGDGPISGEVRTAVPTGEFVWSEETSFYITNRLSRSSLSILSGNEGDEQEELAVWLTDWLSPSGATRRPQVHEGKGIRELCDVLLTHPYGCCLIESRTLAVLNRAELPDRSKLTRNVAKSVEKAVDQLRGAFRNIVAGCRVTAQEGVDIPVERDHPGHAIVLVPDLSLLSGSADTGQALISKFAAESDMCLHILDPGELLRTAQAADSLSRKGQRTSPIMAFDFVLLQRWKKALELETADFRFDVRVAVARAVGTARRREPQLKQNCSGIQQG